MDLSNLLKTVHAMSMGRILAQAVYSEEEDLHSASIGVTLVNPDDRKDTILRKYLEDGIRRLDRNAQVRSQWEALPRGTSFYYDNPEGEKAEQLVVGKITVYWWPKPDETTGRSRPQRKARRKHSPRRLGGDRNR